MSASILKILGILVLIPIIIILGLVALLGIGIASLFIGWYTIFGILLIAVAIIIAIIPPHIKIWIPILVIGAILLIVEQLHII